ncbi:MAG TPA: hypothetical protein VJ646_00075, partial [Candidatus Binatia bacterium]|nr:hypothetical protein [Candidatus Binatia bacterium]
MALVRARMGDAPLNVLNRLGVIPSPSARRQRIADLRQSQARVTTGASSVPDSGMGSTRIASGG